jgi:hypothetical protein
MGQASSAQQQQLAALAKIRVSDPVEDWSRYDLVLSISLCVCVSVYTKTSRLTPFCSVFVSSHVLCYICNTVP